MLETGIINQRADLIQRVIVEIDTRDRERMFESVVHAVETLLSQSSIPFEQVYTIGAGVPGKIDHKQGIAVFQNNLPWRNFPLDRKSTRLNSSHVAISYAVFCLKQRITRRYEHSAAEHY